MATKDPNSVSFTDIAIIGMSGRFPGASTLEQFWRNLCNGVESISTFTQDSAAPNLAVTGGRLEGADLFDASFFGFNPREAEITDPQHRLMLECAWAALESAGYDPDRYTGSIGVFVGASPGWYGIRLFSNPNVVEALGKMQVMVGTDDHFLATRISYKLNLRGPSMSLKTACSTSLVTTHLACQSLLNGECDMALAGGVGLSLIAFSIVDWSSVGTEDGGIIARDGHCRAFDARAQGTVPGEGAGIIVLKRLEDALRDGDCIQAIIKGSAINNDGSIKVGYTAPSVEGQAKVISEAMAISGIEPESISYVEAHGTGTIMGDPIEIAALTRAFNGKGISNGKKHFCGVGSVKTNIGHLDGAAGVASLIKTVLALKHRQIPPSLHFEKPNPNIDFENSPFYVNHQLTEWSQEKGPLRAGVSAFGFGGTNAHVVLEEAPPRPKAEVSRPWNLWMVSAKSKAALQQAVTNLADHLEENPEVNLANAAYTLQIGRKPFPYRKTFVSRDREETITAIRDAVSQASTPSEARSRTVAFMFPGQGAQYVKMGRELYAFEPTFHREVDRCCDILQQHLGFDLRQLLYPEAEAERDAERQLNQTANTQPALFVIEYALAQLWMEWGIRPQAMVGHSIGEYVAGLLAGVFSLEEALSLVAARGRLMQSLPAGSMLAVPLSEQDVQPYLGAEISLGVISSPSSCVLSGASAAIYNLKEKFHGQSIETRLLATSHAFHSIMMDSALDAFAQQTKTVHFAPPRIRYISNVTGTWITDKEATDPAYWVEHLRRTVRIADGIAELASEPDAILLEVGPGRTLSSLVRPNMTASAERVVISSLRHPSQQHSDEEFILNSLGKMWTAGVEVDWNGFHRWEKQYRVPLPTYPFQRQRYWISIETPRRSEAGIHSSLPGEPDATRQPAQQQSFSAAHSRPDIDTPFAAPVNSSQAAIAELWGSILGISGIGIHDNFFDLGGHSLAAIQLIPRLRKTLGVEITPEILFNNPTVAELEKAVETFKLQKKAAHETEVMASSGHPDIPPLEPQPRPERLPLSYAQQRLWFIDQLQGASTEYNVPNAFHLRGKLDQEALAQALSTIVQRHECLRTHFPKIDGEPVQAISPIQPVDLPTKDLSGFDEAERQHKLDELLRREWNEPFDLASGPVYRVILIKLSEQHHVLLRTFHHIVSDGWSEGVFNYELMTIYEALQQGHENPLEFLPVQYADFTLWQRRWLNEEAVARELAFWKKRLQGIPEQLELPKDRPRQAMQTFAADLCHAKLSADETAELKHLAQANQATLYMTLLSAFAVLLQRYSGQEDIVIGSPIANRQEAWLERLIGFFANTLVLRVQAERKQTFSRVLASVRQTTLDAYLHQNLPFERLVEALSPQRSLNTTPIFQVLFVLQNAPMSVPEPKGLKIEPFTGEELAAGELRVRFDLELHAWESGGTIQFYWIYNRELFDRWRMVQMAEHFRRLLKEVTATPDKTLLELNILDAQERHILLEEFNATAHPVHGTTLPEIFEAQVARASNANAIIYGEQVLSYQELNTRANRLAHHLVSAGVGPESIVAIAIERSLEMVVGLLAVLKAGAAYLPLDPDYPIARLSVMLEDAQPIRVLTTSIVAVLLPSGSPLLVLDDRATIEMLAHYPADNLSDADRTRPLMPEHPAYIIYTSGSTGKPKGVMMPGGALVNLLAWHTSCIPGNLGTRVAQFTSLSFDVSAQEILSTLVSGKTLCIPPNDIRRVPSEFAGWLDRYSVNELYAPNLVIEGICEAANEQGIQISSLIHLAQAGEALTVSEHLRRFYSQVPARSPLHNHYGPTETHVITSYELPQEVSEWPLLAPIGRPIWNTRIYILDSDLQPSPIGVIGELYAAGAGLARGYLNRPDMTAERFLPDPFGLPGGRMYRTGDLAWWRRDGVLEFIGRSDQQVKIRGFRIELGEIEAVLATESTVAQAAVVARDENGTGKRLVAYVVPVQGMVVDTAVLRRNLSQRLPDYMVPSAFAVLEALPLTPNGKLDRRALPAPQKRNEGYRAPRTPQEEILCEIFAELLGLPHVGIEDNFFALGGHSLMAMRLVSRVRATLAVELAIRELFEAPTPSELALRLGRAEKARPLLQRRARPEHLPVSYAQQRLWFLNQLRGSTVEYNLPDALRLRGELNVQALEQTVSAIVERHESLRTHFAMVDGKPVQIIAAANAFQITIEDISTLDEKSQREQVLAEMRRAAQEPFDLASGPVFRMKALKLSANDHVLVRVFHHIVWDAWSWSIFDHELAALYGAFTAGQENPLEALPVQYADFALWQREWLNDEVLQGQVAYWKNQLAGISEQLELAKDRPRRPLQTFAGDMCHVSLPAESALQLKGLAQTSNATLYMTLLSAFSVLLQRYSGQDDIVVGSPIANRQEASLEQMIGFFVNTLPMRVQVRPERSFRDLLSDVRNTTLAAYLHQDVPFEKLVEELSTQRVLNTTPIFQVLFALQNAPMSAQKLKGLEVEPLTGYELTVRFDLELHVWERDGRIDLYWMYNRDLFDRWRIEQMARHFTHLLDAIASVPEQPVWQFDMLGEWDRQILTDWNATQKSYSAGPSIHQLFEEQAALQPAAAAVIFEDQQISYSQLNQRANQLAHYLRGMGVAAETLVGVCMERSVEMIVCLMGILKAGGAYVPLDPEYPAERLAFMLEEAHIRVVLTQDKFSTTLANSNARRICMDADDTGLVAQSTANPAPNVLPESLAYVIYTSGSTGKPKGAMNTHRAIRNRLLWMQEAYSLQHGERVLQKTPFTFDVSVWEFFWPLMTGACLVVARPGGHRDGAYLARLIQDTKITTLHFVPSMLGAFLQVAEPAQCCSLRRVICSGEALPVEMAHEFLSRYGAELHNLYGPTEAAVDVTYWECRPDHQGLTTPIVRPIANIQIHILDRHFRPAPIGVPGEIYIGGEGLGRGYLMRPELTAERFVPNPFASEPSGRLYRTGDKGRYLADGNIEFLGRLDYQVKIRGFRIELGEIEAVLAQHPKIHEAAVILWETGEKRLVAYFVPNEPLSESTSQLKDFLRQKLPDYMVPAQYVQLDTMPLTSSGKVNRRALPAPEQSFGQEGYVAPRNAVEELLVSIWAEVLAVEKVGINDSFFDLGGHSILAVSLLARIKEVMHSDLPLQKIFELPSISQLAPIVIEHSARPAQAEKIAELVLQVRKMTPEERKKKLLELKDRQKLQTSSASAQGSPISGAGN